MSNRTKQFVLELDDECYCLRGDRLESIGSGTEVTGDKWIVSDFEGATTQVMTVDAPIRYVAAVIEKRLRESGALIAGGRVLICRKHRRSSRATEAFFVNVPSALYAKYAAAADDDDSHQPLFALPMLLSRELESLRSKKPVVVLLVHDRHVDTLVGNARRTYGAFRASWHRSGGDTRNLIENLANGLRRIEQENNIKLKNIHCHYWLLEHRDDAEWTQELADEMGIPRVQAKLCRLEAEESRYYSSVPSLLAKLSISDSVSTPTQKSLYRAQAIMPWAMAALVVISLLALARTFGWNQQTRSLVAESAIIEDSLVPPEPEPEVLKAAYEEPLALADTLGRAQIVPPLESVLAQMSASVSNRMTFDEVVIEYPEDKPRVTLKLIGRSEKLGDGEGVPTFNAFLAALRHRDYVVVNSELKMAVNDFSFLVQLEGSLN